MNTVISQPSLTYKDILRNRNFALLWSGQSISLMGDAIFIYAINWLILEQTGSALQIGGNVIFTVSSGVIFSSVAGVVADRWNRRVIMIISDLIRGIALLMLFFLLVVGIFNIWLIYLTTFFLTATSAFFSPAYQSIIPEILQKEELVIGRSLSLSSSRLLQVVSAAFSGVIITNLGSQTAILANALSFFFSAAMLLLIKFSQSTREKSQAKLNLISFFQDGVSGWRYIRSEPILVSLFVLFTFTDFGAAFTWPVHALFAEKALKGGAELYGYLSTASLLGSFAGAFFVGRYNDRFNQHPGRSFVLASFLWGSLSLVFSQSTSIPLALGLRFLIGWTLSMIHVPIFALLDTTASNEYRGRVWATIGIGSRVAGAAGTFFSGLLSDATNPRISFLTAGLLLVMVSFLANFLTPIRSARIVRETSS